MTEVLSLLALDFGVEHCLKLESYEEFRIKGEEVLRSAIVFLDINLGFGRKSGIDAYRWLKERNFEGEIVFLTGHAASHPLVQEATRIPGVTLLTKPSGISVIGPIIRSALARHTGPRQNR